MMLGGGVEEGIFASEWKKTIVIPILKISRTMFSHKNIRNNSSQTTNRLFGE